MTAKPLRVSVRSLVAFSVFQPDILPISAQAMELGRQGHLARQSGSSAKAETLLDWQGSLEGREVRVSGRMDLYDAAAQPPVIDEIKLSPREAPQEPLKEHLLQAMCYGHMLCERDGLRAVCLKVSYVTPQGGLTAQFSQVRERERLRDAFFELLTGWVAWQVRLLDHQERRDLSLARLPFPYEAYRPGQREMAAQVYTAIARRKRLYAVMPTGTGKSAAVLYPALKALGQGLILKVFCLTARGTQRIAMRKELDRMLDRGLVAHALTLHAKESLCPMEQLRCHPRHCPRAKGHYDRQQAALEEALQTPVWDGPFVSGTADKYLLCPFEYSLALCEIADVVLCDYNYALDPQIRLSRVFDHLRRITLLIDEAHNLPDRTRDMLSGSLDAGQLRDFRREAGRLHGRNSPLYRACTEMIRLTEQADLPQADDLEQASNGLLQALGDAFTPGSLYLIRDLVSFLGALRRCGEQPGDYTLMHQAGRDKGRITVLNLNPAPYLTEATRRLSGCVFYSATLSPLGAMRSLMGGDSGDACLELPSPFPAEHLKTLRYALNTRYRAREASLLPAAQAIAAQFEAHPCKMIAYFPSFAYLRAVEGLLRERELPMIVQQVNMDERQRLDFLEAFTRDSRPLLGLCVLGGVFAEGVDLPGRALRAAAIVGVGLPQVNAQRDLYRARMNEAMGDGFAFAYRYPGMHKVLQAAGRLIRSDTDRGVLLLLDDRYMQNDYMSLLPGHIRPETVYTIEEIKEKTRAFWQEGREGGARDG